MERRRSATVSVTAPLRRRGALRSKTAATYVLSILSPDDCGRGYAVASGALTG
jgi:hypothetical protein